MGKTGTSRDERLAGLRRGAADGERIAAMKRAEELGRAAAEAGDSGDDGPHVDPLLFGAQMVTIDTRMDAVSRMDVALGGDARQRAESGQFREAIRGAERSELRQEKSAPGQPR